MDTKAMGAVELDDWEVLKSFLPAGWQEQAKALGAFQRARKIKDAEGLLRLLLIHVADDCSLRTTAMRAEQAGVCEVSDVAGHWRLGAAADWLEWGGSEVARRRGSGWGGALGRGGWGLWGVGSTAAPGPGGRVGGCPPAEGDPKGAEAGRGREEDVGAGGGERRARGSDERAGDVVG